MVDRELGVETENSLIIGALLFCLCITLHLLFGREPTYDTTWYSTAMAKQCAITTTLACYILVAVF